MLLPASARFYKARGCSSKNKGRKLTPCQVELLFLEKLNVYVGERVPLILASCYKTTYGYLGSQSWHSLEEKVTFI